MTKQLGQGPPSIGDFSQKKTSKAVLTNTVTHPLTLYPLAVAILGGATIALLPSFAAAGAIAALGGATIGIGSWIVNFCFRGDTYATRYLERLHEQMAEYKAEKLRNIETELLHGKDIEGVSDYIHQAVEQFRMSQNKYQDLMEILEGKLNRGELTFGRYAGTAEQVYLAILDNLEDISMILKTLRGIDPHYIEYRMNELKKKQNGHGLDQADQDEIASLNERISLRQEQLNKINELLTRNEEAVTDLDKTIVAISTMKIVKGRATMDMEEARLRLEEMASRAHEYNYRG